jgi:hypothetical protein
MSVDELVITNCISINNISKTKCFFTQKNVFIHERVYTSRIFSVNIRKRNLFLLRKMYSLTNEYIRVEYFQLTLENEIFFYSEKRIH